MKIRNSLVALTLGSATAVSSVGCSTWNTPFTGGEKNWNPNTWFKKEFQEPCQIATIWKHDILPGTPTGPQSGFGARVYLYNERSQAIPVDGDLTIHGYVTTPSSGDDLRVDPDKKFIFSSEQLASQFSPSDMGASYSIWVPWDSDSGYREEVTLIATFKSKQGTVVQGAPTKLFLPGKSRFPEAAETASSIQPASFQRKSLPKYDVGPSPNKESTRITTIEVPGTSTLAREPQSVSVGSRAGSRAVSLNAPTMLSQAASNPAPSEQAASDQAHGTYRAQALPPPPATPSILR
jgi:hypothetical protein